MVYVLGLHTGHNATAAILKDGKIIACASEERFSREKNHIGFPYKAVEFVLNFANISIEKVDLVVVPGTDPRSHKLNLGNKSAFLSGNVKTKPKGLKKRAIHSVTQSLYKNKTLALAKYALFDTAFTARRRALLRNVQRKYADILGCTESKVKFVDHHVCHALSPAFNLKKKTLIFTLDGEGDDSCATVSLLENGELNVIARTPKYNSLGWFYMQVTKHLGMKGNQHEFKVMGMAPYAKGEYVDKVYQKLKDSFYLSKKNPLVFDTKFVASYSDRYLDEHFAVERFDNLSGGAQKLVEELIIQWVRAGIKKTGVKDLAVSGGVFMNVKANMLVAELPEVNSLFVMPSASDESLVFGACYAGLRELQPSSDVIPFTDLYLGKEYSESYVNKLIKKKNLRRRYKITKKKNIEKDVASLLAKGEIVARFHGRSEWGARALGNRSILANPTNEDTVRVINEMIKGRDFWMPFTPSILPEAEKKYVHNPTKVPATYMCITFRSTKRAQKDLRAAMHPYDFTVRPQVVFKDWNPSYYKLLIEFYKKTGLMGVLNTSFNLHGEPNVETPEDAIHTVDNSGLKYLAIGNILFEKK